MDSGPNEVSNIKLDNEEQKVQAKPTIKKVLSEQTISNPTIISTQNIDGKSDSNNSSNNKAAHLTVDRVFTKEVLQKIKNEQAATPITGNTLANYRNFKLKSQKEAEQLLLNKDVSQVLIINTGGTFCMVKTPKGYMVSKGLAGRLKKFHSFYDEEMAKMLGLPED